MLREHLESLKHGLRQTQADWDHTTNGKKGALPDLAHARDTVDTLLRELDNLEAELAKAEIKLPLVPHKTTVYVPEGPTYPWVATTNSTLVSQPENLERDEARARLIAKTLTFVLQKEE